MADETYDDLLERLDNPPLSWCPNGIPDNMDPEKCVIDALIVGTVDYIEERSGEFGPFSMFVVSVPNASERVQIAALGTVLGRRMASVKPGDRIAVRYKGKAPSGVKGREDYHDYDVAIG